ncbi:MAG: arginyltransferase [Planctomycetes bacterium]|nr:arginyltransferase [Planctomycetota bacterium]
MASRISLSFAGLLEPVVYDAPEACPYLPERTARMPLRLPVKRLSPAAFDQRLAQGDRRSGQYLYRPTCPGCRACESLRIEVAKFRSTATQRRTLRRGDQMLEMRVGPPVVDEVRVALFNKHRSHRNLARRETDIDASGYELFLVDTCCDTVEFTFWREEELIAAAISDRGSEAMSAVYCYFDPDHGRLSPGVYNVLKQIEACREWGIRYLYLGFYIAGSTHMAYKAKYLPHERLIEGQWRLFS